MTRGRLLLAAAVLALGAGRAGAVSTETRLTPKKLRANGLAFRVQARDAGPMKEVEVVVKAEAGKELSPFLEGRLSFYEGKRLVLSCAVERQGRGAGLRYRFLVSSKDVGKVRFSFNEYAFARIKDRHGRVKVIGMPAVDRDWFDLGPFVGGK
jgi:hypothetical protein